MSALSDELTLRDIAAFTPETIGEALACMESALAYFHAHHDYRAVFLRAYYIITKNVLATIEEEQKPPFFLDCDWMSRLAGKFATLYFRSLLTFETAPERERAWKVAHGLALEKKTTVLQDVLLGINAHIKYDLPVAIERNIREHGDARLARILLRRKRDHDNANRILRRSIDEIKIVIPRDYGGSMKVLDIGRFRLDEWIAISVVRYHRERVWWDALALLAAKTAAEYEAVMERMNADSFRMTEVMLHPLWLIPRLAERQLSRTRKSDYSTIRLIVE